MLATVDTDEQGRCRYVCSCKVRGRWVAGLGTWSADDRARNAHGYHSSLGEATDRGERPEDWGSA